jgi:cobyrinic acid a,c-diamide synthase
MPNLYISAAHKSSGKTSVAIGLLAAFAERGLSVQPFKKGPDYIDPMWLTRASGRTCYNLDFNTQGIDEICATFNRNGAGADFSIIEGNKGLHDGVDVEGSDCNAALAKLLETPVVLVLDTAGLTRGIVPLVLGYQAFDPAVDIAGIILNRVAGPRHEGKLRSALEYYTDVPILGAVGREEQLILVERHLGLPTPYELHFASAKINCLKDAAAAGIDLDRILEIAAKLQKPAARKSGADARCRQPDIRLGVARDACFSFYYPDDLKALERAGAELVFFNALHDSRLPRVDALFIGGGFPEMRMAELEANAALREEIQEAASSGLPIYAECGGLMYLCRAISWRGRCREMVGAVPFDAVMHERPQGRGLVRLQETGHGLWNKSSGDRSQPAVRAHEFHHAALENGPSDARYAYRIKRGFGIDGAHDGVVIGNLMANFCHLRDTEQDRWAARFVSFVRDHKADLQKSAKPTSRESVDAAE